MKERDSNMLCVREQHSIARKAYKCNSGALAREARLRSTMGK